MKWRSKSKRAALGGALLNVLLVSRVMLKKAILSTGSNKKVEM